jgi:hypothetical protein
MSSITAAPWTVAMARISGATAVITLTSDAIIHGFEQSPFLQFCPALLGLQGVRYDEPFACAPFSVSSSFLALPPPQPLSVGLSQIQSLRPAIR